MATSMNEAYASGTVSTPSGSDYVLRLDSKTPFVVSDEQISTVTTYTTNGNPIVFEAMGIQSKSGALCTLPKDETGCYQNFIQNRTPISGVKGFRVHFTEEDANDSLYVEWVKDSTGEVDSWGVNNNQYISISSSLVKNPSYLKFNPSYDQNNDGISITSIEIFYDCTPTVYNDFPDYLEAEVVDGEAYISKFKSLNAGTRIVRIPSYYEGYPVVGIKDKTVFSSNYSLGYIELPDTMTSIPEEAFSGCDRLVGVKLSNNLTSIPARAFYNCKHLKNITLPSSIRSIATYAFYNCSALDAVNIPSSLETIGTYAFYKNAFVGQLTLPSSMQSVGEYAFYGTSVTSFVVSSEITFGSANPTIVLHTDIKTGEDMLAGVYGVTDTTLRQYNFNENSYMQYVKYDVGDGESIAIVSSSIQSGNNIFIPSDIDGLPVTYIGPLSFAGSQIGGLNLSYDVKYVGNYAFRNSSIISFKSYEGLQMIGQYAFAQTTYTARSDTLSVYLSSQSIKYMGKYMFQYLNVNLYFSGGDATASLPANWGYNAKSKNITTNFPYTGITGLYPVTFELSSGVTVDIYHNNQMTYVSKDRNKDYLKDLTTGQAVSSNGSVLFKVNCDDVTFETSDITFSSEGIEVISLGNNIFRANYLNANCVITISVPGIGQTRSVTLVPSGTMNPYFYDDPTTMATPASGLVHNATDIDGNDCYDDTGMVSFKINPGQYKKPVFSADNIIGTYDHYTINRDVVSIYGISSDLTINLEEANDYYTVDFVYGEGVEKIIVYPTQNYAPENSVVTNSTVTRNPDTGVPASTYSYSKPQVNFEIIYKEGYSFGGMTISPTGSWKNIKTVTTTDSRTIKRVTVITRDIEITVLTIQS